MLIYSYTAENKTLYILDAPLRVVEKRRAEGMAINPRFVRPYQPRLHFTLPTVTAHEPVFAMKVRL